MNKKHIGESLDSFLKAEKIYKVVTATAKKKVKKFEALDKAAVEE
jgi:hypothetical protein